METEETKRAAVNNSATFAEQVDAVLSGIYPKGEAVLFREDTPFSLCMVGITDLPMLITQKHIKNINAPEETSTRNEHHHGISVQQLIDMPNNIEKPAMLIESEGKDGSANVVVVLNQFDDKKRPIIVTVFPNGKGMYNSIELSSNFVKSLYGRKNFEKYLTKALNEGRLLYWDKEKSLNLLDTMQVRYPQALTSLDFNTIIRKAKAFVNSTGQKNFGKKSTSDDDLYRSLPEQLKENTQKKESKMELSEQDAAATTQQSTDYRDKVNQVREEMARSFIEYIERNPADWQAGWNILGGSPENGKTKAVYRGVNSLYLALTAMEKGYSDPRWVTFNQAKELGASVKQGEKSVPVLFFQQYDKLTKTQFDIRTVKNMTEEERNEYIKENVYLLMKYSSVFNAAQCTGFPVRDVDGLKMSDEERANQNNVIETIISNSAAPISYDGVNRAYYSPSTDSVHLPEIASFKSMQDYYATALHEIAHSTGHKSRLNRDMSGGKGSESYAKEELRAELACVFMQMEQGIRLDGSHFENHAAYLSSWLSAVKDDPKIFYEAAHDAEKIADYVAENYLQSMQADELEAENAAQETLQREEHKEKTNLEDRRFKRLKEYADALRRNDSEVGNKEQPDEYYLNQAREQIAAYEQSDEYRQAIREDFPNEFENEFTETLRDDLEAKQKDGEHKETEAARQNAERGKELPLVVNMFAGPGAGKTTAALELTAALKKEGYNVEYVAEYAKELVLENKQDLLQDQRRVTDEQYRRLDRLRGSGVEIIVTDSPVLLGKIYGESKINETYGKQITDYYNSFENFNLVVKRGETYQTEGRLETKEQAQAIDAKITAMLRGGKIFYGNYHHDEIGKTVDRINATFARLYGSEKETSQPNAAEASEHGNSRVTDTVAAPAESRTVGEELFNKTTWSKINLPESSVGKAYGYNTLVRMPQDGEYKYFGLFVPTKFLKQDANGSWQLNVGDNFTYRLNNDGRQVQLNGRELKDSFAGKLIGKEPVRVAPSRKNAAALAKLEKNVPSEMRALPNWCVYRTKENPEKGKRDKYILSALDGHWAKANEPERWTNFDTAIKYAKENNCEGLTFALDGKCGITCIDLDKSINAEGAYNGIAAKLTAELSGTFTEKSVSGNGVHIFIKDDVLKNGKYKSTAFTDGGDLEVYDNAHLISMTGDMLSATNELGKCPMSTANFLRRTLGEKVQQVQGQGVNARSGYVAGNDGEVVARIRKSKRSADFEDLYTGRGITGNPSVDDMKLANILAFFTDCDKEQCMRIMRDASIYRPDKPDSYYDHTIQKAMDTLSARPSYGAGAGVSATKNRGNANGGASAQ